MPIFKSFLRVLGQFRAKLLPPRLIMKRKLSPDETDLQTNVPKKMKKAFDFSKFNQRHVALRIAYLGHNYSGFVSQPSTTNTIEAKLFKAFVKCNLIADKDSCNYSRCGRTDKGVSAVGQVVSLNVRSNLDEGVGLIKTVECLEKDANRVELPYAQMMHSQLPQDIRVIAWSPVPIDFSARFSCLHRTYKYFFPKGIFDIEKMQEAASKLEGFHDFRNMCRMDQSKIQDFRRTIHKIRIRNINPGSPLSHQIYEITITARSFLWHQVRYIVSFLTLIGAGKESPDLIDYLFDVESCKAKPNIFPASPDNLILYDSGYEDVNWELDSKQLLYVYTHFQKMWLNKSLEQQMLNCILECFDPSNFAKEDVERYNFTFDPDTNFPLSSMGGIVNNDVSFSKQNHKPIKDLKVPKGASHEEMVERITKRVELKRAYKQSSDKN